MSPSCAGMGANPSRLRNMRLLQRLVRLGLTTEAAALLARRAVTRQALGFAAYR